MLRRNVTHYDSINSTKQPKTGVKCGCSANREGKPAVAWNWLSLHGAFTMPNGVPGSNPSSRRPSLRPPSPGSDPALAQTQSRRGSRVLFDTKTPPSILRWEILNRVLALSIKGDWPAVDQHLNSLERNNMEISSAEIEVMSVTSRLLRIDLILWCA